MHNDTVIMLIGLLVNIAVSAGGFIRLSINYEHRFTKLETEMNVILSKLLEKKTNE